MTSFLRFFDCRKSSFKVIEMAFLPENAQMYTPQPCSMQSTHLSKTASSLPIIKATSFRPDLWKTLITYFIKCLKQNKWDLQEQGLCLIYFRILSPGSWSGKETWQKMLAESINTDIELPWDKWKMQILPSDWELTAFKHWDLSSADKEKLVNIRNNLVDNKMQLANFKMAQGSE